MTRNGFSLMTPPREVSAIDLAVLQTAMHIDYVAHPAYASFFQKAAMRDRVRAVVRFARSWFVIKLKRLIRYEMIPLDVRKPNDAGGWLRLAITSATHALQRARRPGVPEPDAQRSLQECQFRANGCVVVSMPLHLLEKVQSLSKPAFSALASRRRNTKGTARDFEESRYYASRTEALALFELIDHILQESGLLETASAYLGRKAKLVDVNPQINDASDDFWRRVFPDLPATLPNSAYFHRDASGGDLKVIVYLSDVTPQAGPFQFVVGSHLLQTSTFETHTCETNDSNGLSGTAPLERELFAMLPARLRMKGAFGNDVVDGGPLDQALSASNWSITGLAGSVVMFDTKGVHRGGMVLDGVRRAITCVIG